MKNEDKIIGIGLPIVLTGIAITGIYFTVKQLNAIKVRQKALSNQSFDNESYCNNCKDSVNCGGGYVNVTGEKDCRKNNKNVACTCVPFNDNNVY